MTVFDFDDFPADPRDVTGTGDEVNTTIYGCRGKAFCTGKDIADARENAISSISTTRDGITATFARPPRSFPAGVGVLPFFGGPGDDNFLNPGNVEDTGDFVPYVVDFSTALRFASVEVSLGPQSETSLDEFAFLELFAGPGASGQRLARIQLDVAPGNPVVLSLSTPRRRSFRSIRFGVGLDIAGCESGCELASMEGSQGFADDIRVSRIALPGRVTLTADDVATAIDIEAAIAVATNGGTQPGTVTLDGRRGPFTYVADQDRSIDLSSSDVVLRGRNGAVITNCDDGVFFSGGVDIDRVVIRDIDFVCTGNGIREGGPIGRKTRIRVLGNSFVTPSSGVILSRLEDSTISRNRVTVGDRGIVVAEGSRRSAVVLNDIDAFRGVDLIGASDVVVAFDRIVAEETGILVRGTSTQNVILGNVIDADGEDVSLGPDTSRNRVIANRAPRRSGPLEIEDQGTENRVRRSR